MESVAAQLERRRVAARRLEVIPANGACFQLRLRLRRRCAGRCAGHLVLGFRVRIFAPFFVVVVEGFGKDALALVTALLSERDHRRRGYPWDGAG